MVINTIEFLLFFDSFGDKKREENIKFNTYKLEGPGGMYVLRNPIEHKALKAPKGLNEANISHIRPNITFYSIICNVHQIERLIGI